MGKNYSKYSEKTNKNIEEEITEEVVENEVEEVVENEVEEVKIIGVVTGCAKLNVRKEPDKQAEVLCVIDKNTEVEVDFEEEATYEDFYKIITSKGVKGYCVKEFIEIK